MVISSGVKNSGQVKLLTSSASSELRICFTLLKDGCQFRNQMFRPGSRSGEVINVKGFFSAKDMFYPSKRWLPIQESDVQARFKINLDTEEKTKTTLRSCIVTNEVNLKMENTNEVSKQNTYTLRRVAWLGLKVIIFIICITCFFYQSMLFCMQYSTYPTKSSTIITSPKMYTPPAITFCDRNP
ncbi:hypothetical protein TNCT_193781 [Trichonephila clavata]|uniref:Uncharacterized protein n=1 Tax=Trichonephila clavata TaxID=2740835 RepID=A0A8X6GRS3_TRICU|nr:hypothetical protein TNCT_193781 [Trichonephila clavata]